ncbi:MAG TPA: hypothetical protein VGM88_20345 [Kofleriaceae bacterium]|jgi:hypothetical protein
MGRRETDFWFFVSHRVGHYTRAGAAERCNFEIMHTYDGLGVSGGNWAGESAHLTIYPHPSFDRIRIDIRGSLLNDRDDRYLPLEDDPQRGLAFAFRDACLALPATVGIVANRFNDYLVLDNPHFRIEDHDRAWFLSQRFTLLYLDGTIASAADAPLARKTLPVPRGLCVFRGDDIIPWYGE